MKQTDITNLTADDLQENLAEQSEILAKIKNESFGFSIGESNADWCS